MDFLEGYSTFFDFLETQAGGSGPHEPPKTNPLLASIPSPRPNFNFGENMAANQPWIFVDAISIHGSQHPLPKHSKKLLPIFDPNNYVLPEDHIKQFMLYLTLLNVEHGDVVCKLFPYTLQGKASTWFSILSQRSITSSKQFQATFMKQFRDDKTLGTLFLELKDKDQ